MPTLVRLWNGEGAYACRRLPDSEEVLVTATVPAELVHVDSTTIRFPSLCVVHGDFQNKLHVKRFVDNWDNLIAMDFSISNARVTNLKTTGK